MSKFEFSDYTISYEDVQVSDAKLRKLKLDQDKAEGMAKYGRFKAWLHYANLQRWQRQGHHFHYLSGDHKWHCTCGLVIHTEGKDGGGPCEYLDQQIVQKLAGLTLDDVQLVLGHRNLPSLRGYAIALIVDLEYREGIQDYSWTAICQGCGEFLVLVPDVKAKSFVKRHNGSCKRNEEGGDCDWEM